MDSMAHKNDLPSKQHLSSCLNSRCVHEFKNVVRDSYKLEHRPHHSALKRVRLMCVCLWQIELLSNGKHSESLWALRWRRSGKGFLSSSTVFVTQQGWSDSLQQSSAGNSAQRGNSQSACIIMERMRQYRSKSLWTLCYAWCKSSMRTSRECFFHSAPMCKS